MRGDGKAGGGLVLAFQSLAALFAARRRRLHVQEWPFFSSARRGANIRSFLRVSRQPDHGRLRGDATGARAADGRRRPARSVDFAAGRAARAARSCSTRAARPRSARVTSASPAASSPCRATTSARATSSTRSATSPPTSRWREAIGGFERERRGRVVPRACSRKRRIPDVADRPQPRGARGQRRGDPHRRRSTRPRAGDHAPPRFAGYGELPLGAQTALRLSRDNRTADYARSGFRLRFEDPSDACTGCAHCITNCPEGIIRFRPDAERGAAGDRRRREQLLQAVRRVHRRLPRAPVQGGAVRGRLGRERGGVIMSDRPRHAGHPLPHVTTPGGRALRRRDRPRARARRASRRSTRRARR